MPLWPFDREPPLVILRPRQDQFTAIKIVAKPTARFFEATRINFQACLEFELADGDFVPDHKRPLAVEFQTKIHDGALALADGETPYGIGFPAHRSKTNHC